MKRSAVSGAEVNHHQSSKKQSLANTNGRMLQAQDLTAGINEGRYSFAQYRLGNYANISILIWQINATLHLPLTDSLP